MNERSKVLTELEDRIDYHFQNRKYLVQAMTHSSFANENKKGHIGSNERLEFLGDAVLEVVSSEFLYKMYPKLPEGELTKRRASLVCEPALAYQARQFDLPRFLLLGKGEEHTGGRNRDSIVSDAAEALIGAIYLDGGFADAKEFVLKFILQDIEHTRLFYDSKTILQEITQEHGESASYRLVGAEGPDHNKRFVAEVYIGEKLAGTGCGHTKKAAEQAAALQALQQAEKPVMQGTDETDSDI